MKKIKTKKKKTNFASTTSAYIKEIPGYFLSKNEQLHYGKLFQKGTLKEQDKAMNKLVNSSLYLVIKLAKTVGHSGLELDDLIQEGNIGLIEAVKRYDYTKGFAFTTYATWWIRQSILKSIKEKATNVRLPNHIYDLQRKIDEEEKKFLKKGEKIDSTTIAHNLGKKVEQIKKHKVHIKMRYTKNLDDFFNGNQNTDNLKIKVSNETVFDEIAKGEIQNFIKKLLKKNILNEREVEIVCLRFGLINLINPSHYKAYQKILSKTKKNRQKNRKIKLNLTLQEVSFCIGISKERIRQIEGIAIKKLKSYRKFNEKVFSNLL